MNDSSKSPEITALIGAGISVVLWLVTVVIGSYWARSFLISIISLPLTTAAVFNLLAWWRARLVRLENEEAADYARFESEYDRADLIEGNKADLKLAANARDALDRYFIPGFSLLFGLALSALSIRYLSSYDSTIASSINRDSLGITGVALLMSLSCLLAGSYFGGVSSVDGQRWLRPAAGWLRFAAVLYFLSATILLIDSLHSGRWEGRSATAVAYLISLFGIEIVLAVLVEFYRPRGAKGGERPLFESRILGVLTDPGGIAANIAYALDYQFGFKVSESWFYRFAERTLIPYALLGLIAFYMLDCFVVVRTSDVALRERFGKPITRTVLQPGLYLKLPRPFEYIRRFPVKEINKVMVGFKDDSTIDSTHATVNPNGSHDFHNRVILWNEAHYESETSFLVASSVPADGNLIIDGDRGSSLGSAIAPVNLLAATIPVYYRIDENRLLDYAYNYDQPREVIERVAHRELVRYLASVDFFDIIGAGRLASKFELERRIRAAVSQCDPPIGVSIEFVGLMGVHPSVEVAENFQNVVAAEEQKSSTIIQANNYRATMLNMSRAERDRLTLEAEGYSIRKKRVSSGEAALFQQQLSSYQVAPGVYRLRRFLEILEKGTADLQQYIMASDSKRIYVVDLQEKLRPDLLEDLDLNLGNEN